MRYSVVAFPPIATILCQIFRTKFNATVQNCPLVSFAFQTRQFVFLLMDMKRFWQK